MADSLKIEIDGSGLGVPAEALRVQLEQALRFLMDGAADDAAEEGAVEWIVTRVSMNSPLVLQLERSVRAGSREPAVRPGEDLARAFARLKRGEPLGEELSPARLHALEKMASRIDGVRRLRIQAGIGEVIEVDPDWAAELRRARNERRLHDTLPEQWYSIVGRLEGVDVHGSRSEFYVYDALTDQRMRCLFTDSMLDNVGRSLRQRVEVAGMTRFGPGNTPKSMNVASLKTIHVKSGSFLDRLKAAHDRGPISFTGGLSVEDAIDEVRGATD